MKYGLLIERWFFQPSLDKVKQKYDTIHSYEEKFRKQCTKSPRWLVAWSRDADSQKRQSKAVLSRQFSRELRQKTARTLPTQARSFLPE